MLTCGTVGVGLVRATWTYCVSGRTGTGRRLTGGVWQRANCGEARGPYRAGKPHRANLHVCFISNVRKGKNVFLLKRFILL